MKRQRMNNKNGFTLIETTVAMLVMMVVGLGATSLFLYSVRYNSGASQRSIAMAVAQQRLEVLRGVDYDDPGISFGVHAPQTVVIAPSTTTYTQTGNAGSSQPSGAPFAVGSYAGLTGRHPLAFVTLLAFAKPKPTPMPTPTPTTGGGGGGGGGTYGAPAGSSFYQIQTEVVPFPIGTAVANATQKEITISVVPLNGNGDDAWSNQNPVQVVFRRSLGTPGPYKQ